MCRRSTGRILKRTAHPLERKKKKIKWNNVKQTSLKFRAFSALELAPCAALNWTVQLGSEGLGNQSATRSHSNLHVCGRKIISALVFFFLFLFCTSHSSSSSCLTSDVSMFFHPCSSSLLRIILSHHTQLPMALRHSREAAAYMEPDWHEINY